MPQMTSPQQPRVLVTGATGYIGGRLVPRLLAAGYRVRVLVRGPERLQGRAWLPQVAVQQGDIFEPASLSAALAGTDAAYYLVHSLASGADFHQRDLEGARRFGHAARAARDGAGRAASRPRAPRRRRPAPR